jgi:hypothetical protein
MYRQLKSQFDYNWEDSREWERELNISNLVRDVEGNLWDVRDARTTNYGFDLLFGQPVSRRNWPGDRWRLIATQELYDFWERNRLNRATGVVMDLPAGRMALYALRRRLGFHCLDDLRAFWTERRDDLATLTLREFAARHGVSIAAAHRARTKSIGRTIRESGWWRKPEILGILQSDITAREKGEKLGISRSQARRLSCQACELRDAYALHCSSPESLAA